MINNKNLAIFIILFNICLLKAELSAASDIKVAVASNFKLAMEALATSYEEQTNKKVAIISGATRKLFTQIKHGAPFDIFYAADIISPKILEKEHFGVAGSRYTYAIGQLVLWSPQANYIDAKGDILKLGNFKHLAMANPKLAPYGKAAQEVLQKMNLFDSFSKKIVQGENISQTFHFINTRSVPLGFVSWPQLKSLENYTGGSWWVVPQDIYTPIKQQVVLLNKKEEAQNFFKFVKSNEGEKIIKQFGYHVP